MVLNRSESSSEKKMDSTTTVTPSTAASTNFTDPALTNMQAWPAGATGVDFLMLKAVTLTPIVPTSIPAVTEVVTLDLHWVKLPELTKDSPSGKTTRVYQRHPIHMVQL